MLSIPNQHLKPNLTLTPQIAKNRTAQRAQQLKHKNSNNDLINQNLNIARLCVGRCAIHHYGRLFTAVTCDADHPLRVF